MGFLDRFNRKIFSIEKIEREWEQSGLLDGLESGVSTKVAISLELTAQILIVESEMSDLHDKIQGIAPKDIDDYYRRIDTVIFPIMRRVVVRFNEGYKYVPEIVSMVKGEFDTKLWKAIYEEDESAIEYFYNVILPKWSTWHQEREHQTYKEFKKATYEKYLDRQRKYDSNIIQNFESFIPMDYEAEFAACVADRIEIELRKRHKEL